MGQFWVHSSQRIRPPQFTLLHHNPIHEQILYQRSPKNVARHMVTTEQPRDHDGTGDAADGDEPVLNGEDGSVVVVVEGV